MLNFKTQKVNITTFAAYKPAPIPSKNLLTNHSKKI